MSDHYYTAKPNTKSNPMTWEATLDHRLFQFMTDSGVFSKGSVDYGSRLLIETVDLTDFPSGDLLDVGCGYGPMGMALAAKDESRVVDMVDVNLRALELAKQNVKINRVKNCRIYQSNIYESVEKTDFVGIFSNPPIRAGKEVVHEILEKACNHLIIGGRLTIVIQKKQGAPSAKKKMEAVFGNAERLVQDKGYWILESIKTD
ncbi:class I SAM-dependent methyltransferase [Alkalibacterium sp. MB6]|uniref:class I SAM-dependent methyltransferase n=1 Tax=Alkalibacterium sp. MB6 TaxID=2081965 RepID=UPI00137994F9|nr:class I SAM-dependent methyltransferase [Alkalibacterium sp. MB6]